MQHLPHIDQSADTIRLYLLGDAPDSVLDQFTVLDTASTNYQTDYTLTINILGESHAFTLYHKGHPLVREICACTDGVFANEPIVSTFLHDTPATIHAETSGVQYSFSHNRLQWPEGADHVSQIESRFNEASRGLLKSRYDFPKTDQDERDAYTAVWLLAQYQQIEIHSVHTYPNEDCMVVTTSIVQLDVT